MWWQQESSACSCPKWEFLEFCSFYLFFLFQYQENQNPWVEDEDKTWLSPRQLTGKPEKGVFPGPKVSSIIPKRMKIPRGLRHRKKRPGVDFFVKASFGVLTNLHNQEHPIYSNITSSTLPATSLHCCGQVILQPCKMNCVKPQILYSIFLYAKHRILQAPKFHWKF